jgi:hypothetical protein
VRQDRAEDQLPMTLIATVGAAFTKEKVAVDAAITAPR